MRLHIETLVLDGMVMSRQQRALLRLVVEAELSRLLASGQLNPRLASGVAVSALDGGTVLMTRAGNPCRLGTQIANAVYSGIGPAK